MNPDQVNLTDLLEYAKRHVTTTGPTSYVEEVLVPFLVEKKLFDNADAATNWLVENGHEPLYNGASVIDIPLNEDWKAFFDVGKDEDNITLSKRVNFPASDAPALPKTSSQKMSRRELVVRMESQQKAVDVTVDSIHREIQHVKEDVTYLKEQSIDHLAGLEQKLPISIRVFDTRLSELSNTSSKHKEQIEKIGTVTSRHLSELKSDLPQVLQEAKNFQTETQATLRSTGEDLKHCKKMVDDHLVPLNSKLPDQMKEVAAKALEQRFVTRNFFYVSLTSIFAGTVTLLVAVATFLYPIFADWTRGQISLLGPQLCSTQLSGTAPSSPPQPPPSATPAPPELVPSSDGAAGPPHTGTSGQTEGSP